MGLAASNGALSIGGVLGRDRSFDQYMGGGEGGGGSWKGREAGQSVQVDQAGMGRG